ncbi:hypothetical protein WJX73_009234 [Symbiochloris irregularis]|uniref:ABC transporter domain-containing protein n=1 Tax=Symbiochloris irregularis TaxID=706552 RepID=A0AAW1PDS6_9CHLO
MGSVGIGHLSPAQKRALAALLIAGSGVADVEDKGGRVRRPKVAVDALFARRLAKILQICVPGIATKEAGLILAQGLLLLSRTWLTDYISRIEARAGRHLISQNFDGFAKGLVGFSGVAVPAAIVNAGLKYMQKRIQLAFQRRLNHRLHDLYCNNRAYYSASVLGGLTNADQRITEDVEKFAFAISELYGYTFKPLLDVLMFSRSLARIMGWRGQFVLYAYYLTSALGLRALSPPLALITAQETGLSGAFRSAHQRLVTNAEEVAFNDPPAGAAERLILNQHLQRMLRHSRLSALQRFFQQVCDGYFVKYFASVVALLVYGAPIYFQDPSKRGTQDDITQDYIRAMRLLQNTSKGIGDLILVYKRITSLAGHTSRVAELLEQVQRLGAGDAPTIQRELYMRNVSSHSLDALESPEQDPLPEPSRVAGDIIRFHRLALNAPDGTPLVRDLSFDVPPGRCVMIMGPNGCGKSSLFRVLAGLWPVLGGEVTVPGKGSMFYLSQRPYLVTGSLRDQILYPWPPQGLLEEATKPRHRLTGTGSSSSSAPRHTTSHANRITREFSHMAPAQLDDDELDARLEAALDAVELDYLLGRGRGWDQVQNWTETLSGGEKQRLAMARLLFHAPTYAILDECTSAVSADGEVALYKALQRANITLLSIAHRPALKRFHSTIIHFEGAQNGQSPGWHLEELRN